MPSNTTSEPQIEAADTSTIRVAGNTNPAGSCCSPTTQAGCCAAPQKPACCDTGAASGTCGCQA
jgi:hypothetical protein